MLGRPVVALAVLLSCSSHPHDTAQLWPGKPPRPHAPTAPFSLTASDGSGLALVRVDAKAVVEGPLALTELHLYFHNPEHRQREGRFSIALPERAALSRFAMEIGGRMQEAEVVPTELARRAYEDFLHRRQDPALLEKAAGNEFSARVFPIPADADKHIVIAFSQELTGEYVLPLRGLPKVDRIDVAVEAAKIDGTRVTQDLHERRWQPDRDFTVATVGPAAVGAGSIIAIQVAHPGTSISADAPSALTMLIDTSASRALGFDAYLAEIGDLVRALHERYGDVALTVAAYDQETQPIYAGPAAGFGEAQLGVLLERGAAGASNLEQALAWMTATSAPTRLVVVTDAVVTAGHDGGELVAAAKRLDRLDVVLAGGIRDDRFAATLALAGKRAGDVHDLDRGASGVAIGLGESVRTDVHVTVDGASWVYPHTLPAVRAGSDRVMVYARLPKHADQVAVGIGDDRRTLAIARATPAMLQRAFAGAEIAELEQELRIETDAEDLRAMRADIAKRSVAARVVSSQTAMLVLETDHDYTRYGIDRTALADVLVIGDNGIEQTHRSDVAFAPEEPDDGTTMTLEEGGTGTAMTLDEGRMGKRDSDRSEVILQARQAGSLGTTGASGGGFASVTGTGEIASGFDDTNVYGGLMGNEVAGKYGYGRGGFGPGGGGTGWGTIGTGRYGTIGKGSGTGTGYGAGAGWGSGGMRGRTSFTPTLRVGQPAATGNLDKAIIRRYIKRNLQKVVYCYERELLANSTLAGTVIARFTIGADGLVKSATADGVSKQVASCVASVIDKIEFPRPTDGGFVAVSYPFAFSPPSRSDAVRSVVVAPPPLPPPPAPTQHAVRNVDHDGAAPLTGQLADVMAMLASHDARHALAVARTWRASAPGDVLALIALGEALEANEQYAAAARMYGSIIDLFPARADLRRFAGERLERVGGHHAGARELAIDTYRRAVADRPDHVSGHRLLAYALERAGDHAGAFAAILNGMDHAATTRFPGSDRVLAEDISLIAAAYAAHGGNRADITAELAKRGLAIASEPSMRFVLYWETDANDVDFHIRDASGDEAWYANRQLASGGELYADVTTGYGPECFTIRGAPTAGPYELSLHYYSQGPMGYGMGLLQVVRFDGKGNLAFEDRPYVIMADNAFVELGRVR